MLSTSLDWTEAVTTGPFRPKRARLISLAFGHMSLGMDVRSGFVRTAFLTLLHAPRSTAAGSVTPDWPERCAPRLGSTDEAGRSLSIYLIYNSYT